MEASAYTGENVSEAFQLLTREILINKRKVAEAVQTGLEQMKQPKSWLIRKKMLRLIIHTRLISLILFLHFSWENYARGI